MGLIKSKAWVLTCLTFSLVLVLASTTTIAGASAESSSDYVYLTYSTPDPAHAINVSWRASENYIGTVHYGTTSGDGTPSSYSSSVQNMGAVTAGKFDGYIQHVELTGLEPDTTYYFICGDSEHGWSEELSFRTAPTEKEDIRLVAGGDSRSDSGGGAIWPEARNNVTQLMGTYNPDFVVFSGDFLWSGEEQTGADTWDNWLGAWYKYARGENGRLIPLVPVIGNHEITYPQPSVYNPEQDASNYYMLFNLPENEQWYSLDWGPNLHLTVLDSEIRWAESNAWGNQLDWLRQDLLESEGDTWQIATAHRPAFSSGEHGSDRNIQEDWVPEFDLYHADLYINGHDHGYERTHPVNLYLSEDSPQPSPENGTIYLTSAGWGAPLYGGGSSWFTACGVKSKLHFSLIDIYENDTLRLKGIDVDNNTFDELTISKGAPAQYELSSSIDPSGGGSVSLSPSGETYNEGAEVTVTAEPESGYEFDHWSGDTSGTSPTTTITMDSDKNITAHFTETGEDGDGIPMVWIGSAIVIIVIIVGIFVATKKP